MFSPLFCTIPCNLPQECPILTKTHELRTGLAQRLLHSFRHVFFQRSVVAPGVTFCERRWHFAGTGGEDCEEIARPGTFDWIECDAGNRVGYGAADTLDDGLVRNVSRMREFGSAADLDIFAVASRRERMRLDGAVTNG